MKRHSLFIATLLLTHYIFAQSQGAASTAIRLVDKQINLSGTLSGATAQSFTGLEAGDKIIINCTRLSKKGSLSLSVKDLNKGAELYKRDGFDTLRDVILNIPAKGIYTIDIRSASLLDKDVKLTVDRIPAAHITTTPKKAHDTTSMEILSTVERIYTKNSPKSNKSVITIKLPPNTAYWTYWIGAGSDALDKMKAFEESCATIGALYPSNPLVLYGMKYLHTLPMSTAHSTISYHFMDTQNATAFKNNQQYSFYTFKAGERITTEFSFAYSTQADMQLAISNESGSTQDVKIRVVAFTVK